MCECHVITESKSINYSMVHERNRKQAKRWTSAVQAWNGVFSHHFAMEKWTMASFVCFRVRFNQLYHPVQSFIIFIKCVIFLLDFCCRFRCECALKSFPSWMCEKYSGRGISMKWTRTKKRMDKPSRPNRELQRTRHTKSDDFRKQIAYFRLCNSTKYSVSVHQKLYPMKYALICVYFHILLLLAPPETEINKNGVKANNFIIGILRCLAKWNYVV